MSANNQFVSGTQTLSWWQTFGVLVQMSLGTQRNPTPASVNEHLWMGAVCDTQVPETAPPTWKTQTVF